MSRDDWLDLADALVLSAVIVTWICLAYAVAAVVGLLLMG